MKKNPYALLIDTSTERGMMAILNGKKVLYQTDLLLGFNHSQHLLPEMAKGFDALGIRANQLVYIAVGIGPGSYTGIRLAATVAKTLAFSCQIPLVSLCSLEGFIPCKDGSFAAIIDAKISGAYVLKGVKREEIVTYTSQPQVISLQLVGDFISDVDVIVTSQSIPLRSKLEALFPQLCREWQESGPIASHMALLAYDKFCKKDFAKEDALELLYLRRTQAEIELLSNSRKP